MSKAIVVLDWIILDKQKFSSSVVDFRKRSLVFEGIEDIKIYVQRI